MVNAKVSMKSFIEIQW